MELTWMGKYRTFVEMLIKYGNSYAQSYNTEGDDYGISAVFFSVPTSSFGIYFGI